jgi:energy-coupling factor transport system permease protein
MKVFEGLKFKRISSPIHRLDPRTKFIVSCVIFAQAFLFTELLYLIILFMAQIPLVLLARVHKQWTRSLRGSLVLTLLIFFTNLIVGVVSNDFQLTSEVLTYSTSMSLRFVVLMTSFSIFFLTTSPDDLGLALEQSHVPYEFCFAFTTAVRFVPVLAREAQTIMDAQKSRGLELEKGGFMKRIRNYIPILIPLIVSSIRRSLELAEAMETRAFGAKKLRTSLFALKITREDILTLILCLVFLIITVYVRLYIPIPEITIPIPRP